jgi:hypothetical protein
MVLVATDIQKNTGALIFFSLKMAGLTNQPNPILRHFAVALATAIAHTFSTSKTSTTAELESRTD